MPAIELSFSAFFPIIRIALALSADTLKFLQLSLRPTAAIAAENLFLRKQLSLYVERNVKPRRPTDSIRFTLAHLSRFFDWRNALTIVKPDTLIRWHRKGFRLFWKWKSRPRGRPPVPADIQKLIVEMAMNNPTWVRNALPMNSCSRSESRFRHAPSGGTSRRHLGDRQIRRSVG
jgi:hypothetical protein